MVGRSLKAAPRREVLVVERLGDWGEIRYTHALSCGHSEIRPRRTVPGRTIACSGCLKAAQFAAGPMLPAPRRGFMPSDDGVAIDELAGVEAEIARLRAGIAKAFRVPAEAVDVAITSDDDVAYALVFLDADQARRVAGLTMSDLTD